MSDEAPIPHEEYVLSELASLRGLVENLFEIVGVELRSRPTPAVLSIGHEVERLVQPALTELSRQAVEVKTGQYRHVIRDPETLEISGIVDVPLTPVNVTVNRDSE